MEITGTDNYRPPTLIHPASPGEGSLSALCQASLACRVPSKVPIASAEMGFWPLTGTVRFYRCTPPFPASALQLLLQKPPTSPFTASPFDLVINPGQRANSPVRPWLHPTFGRARLRLARTRHKCWHWRGQEEQKKWNKWRGDPSLWKPLEARPTRPGARGACLGCGGPHQPFDAAPHGLNVWAVCTGNNGHSVVQN